MASKNKEHVYYLCKGMQSKEEGRRIVTMLNMDTYKTFEAFLKALAIGGTITTEEVNEITSVYYGDDEVTE